LFGFILYHLRNRKLWARIAFALIIGGAIGNLYDRMAFSMVRDFIRIVYFGMDIPFLGGTGFAIFNLADSCLVIGVIMYVVYVLFMETKDREALEKANEKTVNDEQEELETTEKEEPVVENLEPNGEQQ
jgi:signal peptidase II